MNDTSNIREHMSVVCSCGSRLGTVDHVEGDTIKLTKNDSPDGKHHYIPAAWVDKIDGNNVTISKNSVDAQKAWTAA